MNPDSPEQDSIPSGKASRIAALAGAGAQVGVNYLKHYGKRAMGGENDTERLHEANAGAIYKTFSRLKGGPLKLAQMLSIDKSLLPTAYQSQFAQAQYSAPPLSYPLVVRTFRREFGKAPGEIFETFSTSAAHGASIGQVHRATIGERTFAVKIQYPGIADSLVSDLAVVKPVALQIMGMKEHEVEPYFQEVKARLLEETDYRLELERSMELSAATQGRVAGVRFPTYYPEFSNARILTMDWIDGQPLDRFAERETDPEKRRAVAQAIWDFYHLQIHDLLQFHADPHPGNFLVDQDNQVIVLDFGCTKKISPAFHRSYFRFLNPALLRNRPEFEAALFELDILTDTHSARECELILETAIEGAELLGRPFHHGEFDFSDPEYLTSIMEMGERQRTNPDLKNAKGATGLADSVYLNRAYFGVYSLMGLLRAKVKTDTSILAEAA